jgi:hypothetical protein
MNLNPDIFHNLMLWSTEDIACLTYFNITARYVLTSECIYKFHMSLTIYIDYVRK